jgi:hypothetical protein
VAGAACTHKTCILLTTHLAVFSTQLLQLSSCTRLQDAAVMSPVLLLLHAATSMQVQTAMYQNSQLSS